MARESRGAVVSVRISDDEQSRLRHRADALGITVSELIRSAALAEIRIEDDATQVSTKTLPAAQVDGVVWNAPQGAQVAGSTLTF